MNCNSSAASRAGFIKFLRRNVGIPTSALPDDSEQITDAFCAARQFIDIGMGLECVPLIYNATLYNTAASMLLNYAYDEDGQTFFAGWRKKLGLNDMPTGFLQSAADQGTAGTRQISKALDNLTLADLQMAKDPYGRAALAVLMDMGTLWGYTP